jgi:hypothetical protein
MIIGNSTFFSKINAFVQYYLLPTIDRDSPRCWRHSSDQDNSDSDTAVIKTTVNRMEILALLLKIQEQDVGACMCVFVCV